MSHAEKARDYFLRGYNCAQAVFAAYCDLMKMEETEALRLASSFGAGMGCLREVCGAVSGIFLAAGELYGYDSPDDAEAKKSHYARIQSLGQQFQDLHGTLICRDLLAGLQNGPKSTPNARTAEYYKERPCIIFVMDACDLFDRYINENPPKKEVL